MTAVKNFWSLTYVLLALAAVYVYLVSSIVLGVVAREDLRNQLAELQSSVTGLESNYVSLSDQITPELALNMGFKDDTESSGFAYLEKSGTLLSYRGH